MREPAHPARTTVLVGLLLALLLAVAYAITSGTDPTPTTGSAPPAPVTSAPTLAPTPTPSPTPTPTPTPASPSSTPRPGAAFPVRRLGALDAGRSVLVNGHGDADLRYRRAARNGTRLHFICTGCDADTWLVEQPRNVVVGGGPLADPDDATSALDTVRPGATTDLLVRAPAEAAWTVTLTPFDAVPVHEQTFDALGDDVVAVRARADLQIRCGGPGVVATLARASGAEEYAVVQRRDEDQAGSWPLTAPTGSDVVVVVVSCPGRWTVTVP